MYSIIWRYKVKQNNKIEFELEYGSRGSWSKLFGESKSYKGSALYKSEEEIETYILIDTWTDKQSYEDFKKTRAEIYNKLSHKFENIYESEKLIGTYSRID